LHLAGEMAKQAIGQIIAFCCRSKILVFFILIIFFGLQLGVIGKKFQMHFDFL
jgi:hypothetical protein